MSNLKWMYNPEWEYYTLVSSSELREADKEYGIDKLKRELNAANQRIKRLENVEKSHADVLKAIDNWMKQQEAKEAKP